MERNAQLMFKLSPLFMQGNVLFLSDYDGNFFNFNTSSEDLSARQLDFFFCCDSFYLYQETVNDKKLCFFSNHISCHSFDVSEDIENISVFFDDNKIIVFLFFSEGKNNTEIKCYNGSGEIIKTDLVTTNHAPGMIYHYSGLHIDLEKNYAWFGEGIDNLFFDVILSVSEAGLIVSSEAEDGHDTIFIPFVNELGFRLAIPFSGVLSASFNLEKKVFYLSVTDSGQQKIAEIDAINGQTIRIGDELYGSVSLLRDGKDTLVYVTDLQSHTVHLRF